MVEEEQTVRMSYCGLGMGGWVKGFFFSIIFALVSSENEAGLIHLGGWVDGGEGGGSNEVP